MRVFISADIEGIVGTTSWEETGAGKPGYPAACQQMTAEVKAACEGAIAAGADYILIKDAHGSSQEVVPTIPSISALINTLMIAPP